MNSNELSSQDEGDTISSQIEVTPFVKSKIEKWGIKEIKTVDDLNRLGKQLHNYLEVRPYNEDTKSVEEKIRWKRTGAQVLEDGYVYYGKACTDIVVAFITLAKATGINETRFVKLIDKNRDMVHSVGEFKVQGAWYIYDIANSNAKPILGEITETKPFKGYSLWKKGRDSWQLGLSSLGSINKIKD
jgi:hypothetical protein